MDALQGLDTLLEMDGIEYNIAGGYWVKFSARRVDVTSYRPHGLKYSLTLHNNYGNRLIGYDNAHQAKIKRRKFSARREAWDHKHNRSVVTDYDFDTAWQLLEDFWDSVDQMLLEEGIE